MASYRRPIHKFALTAVILFIVVFLARQDYKYLRSRDPTRIFTDQGYLTYSDVELKVFRPMGYELVEESVVPVLKYINRPTCHAIMNSWLAGSVSQDESAAPPRNIPERLLPQYTMNGYAVLDHSIGYCDDRSGTHSADWPKSRVDHYLAMKPYEVTNYGGEGRYIGALLEQKFVLEAVYNALKTYGVRNQNGLVIGSLSPWVEAYALKLGAATIKTVEYMKITTPQEYPAMSYAHPLEIAENYKEHINAYDFIVSFSSIEHSGLGRFGDALDPMGDIKEVQKIYCMLKEGGLLFLGIPIGRDTVKWNVHRTYGRLRLAMMAAGFDILDSFHFNERFQLTPENFIVKEEAQPVFVLRKQYTQDAFKF